MKSIISLIVVTAAFLFSNSAFASSGPELQCKVIDFSTGYQSTWRNNCESRIQYGNSAMVQFRIVGLPYDKFSYFWSGAGKNFNPDSSTPSLNTQLGGGAVKVVVFTKSGRTYALETTYYVSSNCPTCHIP
jgi:hypothetical protein